MARDLPRLRRIGFQLSRPPFAQLAPDLQQFFVSSLPVFESALQVARFQQSNGVKMLRYLKEKVSKQHELLEKMSRDMTRSQEVHEWVFFTRRPAIGSLLTTCCIVTSDE